VPEIKLNVDTSPIDKVNAKLERLVQLLKEANSLVTELASTEIELKVNI